MNQSESERNDPHVVDPEAPADEQADDGGWWYLWRGLVSFFGAFAVSWIGYWAGWRWLQLAAFGAGVMGFIFVLIGGSLLRADWPETYRKWARRHNVWHP